MSVPTLEPNDKGVFYAYWSEGRRSKRQTMGTSDPATAQRKFALWLLARQDDPESDKATSGDHTVGDCWFIYEEKHLKRSGINQDTPMFHKKALEPHFWNIKVTELTQVHIDEYVEKRTTGKLGRTVKPQTVRREIQSLFAAIHFCAKPAQQMNVPVLPAFTLPDAGEPRDRWLTNSEVDQMFAAAERLRRGTRLSRGERFLWLALKTAGRMSALLELTWDRVDFETRVIHLDVPGRKKTKKRRASVPISDDLMPILQQAYAERIEKKAEPGKPPPKELVMDNQADVWATVQLIAIEAGLGGVRPKLLRSEKPKATGISPHVLRHTAATHMARRGVPLWIIAKILGNTLQMVERVYAKHSPDDLREAINLISKPAKRELVDIFD
jgi:integrase